MKLTRICAALFAALCILSVLPPAGALSIQMNPMSTTGISAKSVDITSVNDNYPISVEQAKASVRIFMNDLSLEPVLRTTYAMEIGNYYYLTTDTAGFYVNQNSGIVEFAHFDNNQPSSAELTLTRDEAYARATAFAGEKYDGFSGRTWNLVIDTVNEDFQYVFNETLKNWERVDLKAYNFVLREEKEQVLLPNVVHVMVNGKTGGVIDYWGVDRLISVASLKSTISRSDAIESATAYTYHKFTVRSAEGYLAVVTRYQNVENLAWVINLHGAYPWNPEYDDTSVVIVDAADGNVLGTGWSSIWPEAHLTNHLY